jgi:hypothetical protein
MISVRDEKMRRPIEKSMLPRVAKQDGGRNRRAADLSPISALIRTPLGSRY